MTIETPTLPSPYEKTSLTGIVDIDDEYLEKEINRSRRENNLKKSRAEEEEEEVDEWKLKYAKPVEPVNPEVPQDVKKVEPKQVYQISSAAKEYSKNCMYKITLKRTDGKAFYYWYDSKHRSSYKFYLVGVKIA